MATWRDSRIKNTLQKIVVCVFFFTGIPYVRFLVLRAKGPVLRTIVMHDIKESEKGKFSEFLDFLQKKFNIVSPDDFECGNFDTKKLNILLTFDDGYESWEKIVLPELSGRSLGAYFFVTSGFLDTFGDVKKEEEFCREKLKISHRKPLSLDGLRLLAKQPRFVIGGHTVNHLNLEGLEADAQETEILENKVRLEDELGYKIETFAYPFGIPKLHVGETSGNVVRNIGYKRAFTTNITFTDVSGSIYNLARVCTEYKESNLYSYVWIMGGYDMISAIKRKFSFCGCRG